MSIKSLFCAVSIALLPLGRAAAEDATRVRITDADGQYTEFVFSKDPVVTFTDDYLEMTTLDQTVDYPMTQELTFTFSSEATAINDAHLSRIASFYVSGDAIIAEGMKAGSELHLYDTAGMLRHSAVVDANGKAEIGLSDLARGVYIVKTSNQSFKIYKK